MEIMAVIKGLEALRQPSNVELFSDSQYVLNAIEEWMGKWKKFGWKRSVNARATVKNADLWRRLDELLQRHVVKSQWVRGHDGHAQNERCDEMAEGAAAKVAGTPAPAQTSMATEEPDDLFSDLTGGSEERE
jgi:ribonuclease HI